LNYERLYEYRFRNVDQAARQAVWEAVAAFLYERLGRPERVLDPAAGRGEFICAVPARERWGVDRVRHREWEGRSGVTFLHGEAMEVELPRSHFDGVLVSNFVEHLPSPDAVAAFLGRMRESMAPGGRIAVMGPNYRVSSSRYWDFADHWLALTDLAVTEHLYAAGFTPVEVVPRFLPYSFTGRLPASRRLAAMYLAVPAVWRLLGKQYLVIAER
jgi:2-polyprenyl-3-methyl-5-hydroxy-6-metoxy-1,4-benzoquinol methylase